MPRYFLLIYIWFLNFKSKVWIEGTFEHAFILTVYNDEDLVKVGFDHLI